MNQMEHPKLNSKNFLDYALQNYENPECKDMEEFSEDVNRIKYLKRLFSRHEQDDDFKSRLIVNHLIVFNNVFGVLPSARILFFRVEEKYHSVLKTCLFFLERLPEKIPEVELDLIPIDHKVLKKLETEI
tara:strand:+ start:969 stop:1358 length:390 start_codon:yes stop_codon:yes gene_type:complete